MRSRYSILDTRFWIVAAALCAVVLAGCAQHNEAIVPKAVAASRPSYDQNVANSGVLGVASDGSLIVTSHFRDRYNALIDLYGKQFVPPLQHDAGVELWVFHVSREARDTAGEAPALPKYTIDREHAVKMSVMQGWKRSGTAPADAPAPTTPATAP